MSGEEETSEAAMISVGRFAKKLAAGEPPIEKRPAGRSWNLRARDCLKQICVIYLVLKNPRSPLRAKIVAALSVGYIFSPIQLIPSFIPVIGWMDDILVLSVGMKLLTKLTPPAVMEECTASAVVVVGKWLRETDSMPR
jgi:uncharacterized membrane protein YkvA (DUF1232 family)